MKRIIAILLLGILLFNWGGYRLVTGYLEDRADSKLEASFDANDYNESELVSIKMPARFPYYTGSLSYERADGEITIDDVIYKYVKRRLYNDTLELLCIRNTSKASVQNARDDFFRLANDLVASNTSSKKSTGTHTHLTKLSVQDFTDDHHFFASQFWNSDPSAAWNRHILADMRPEYLSRLDKPPQA